MKRNVITIIILVCIIGNMCCYKYNKKQIPTTIERTVDFIGVYYRSSFAESSVSISYENIEDMYKNSTIADTIYVAHSKFVKLKSILNNATYTKPTGYMDCQFYIKIGNKKLYMDYFGNINTNKGRLQNANIAYWRYLLKTTIGYYDDFWDVDILKSEMDVERFGIPHNFRYKEMSLYELNKLRKRRIIIMDKQKIYK